MTGKSVVRAGFLIGALALSVALFDSLATASAETRACVNLPCDTTFNVEVHEVLGVSITVPDNWASGDTGDFLRNAVGLSVISNNGAGFTASMKTKTSTTALTNQTDSSYTIDTLAANTAKNAISESKWGYSLGNFVKANANDTTSVNESSNGVSNSTYKPMSASATTILYSATATSDSQDIYFGAKADAAKASGTYANTVVISVVSGIVTDSNDNPNDNPVDPVDPATPEDANPTNPVYDDGRTVHTETSTSGSGSSATTTTTTEISSGDTRSSYANPAGVTTSTTSDIGEGTPLATGLAVTAGVAAVTGVVFLVLAKRNKDDEEDDVI